MNRLKRHLTVANVLSCIALFVALGSGAALAATKAIQLRPGQVKATNIANQAVSNPKLRTQAVTSGKIKNLGINAADLGTSSVLNSKIAKKAVTNAKLGNEAVGNSKLGKEAVGASKLAKKSVTEAAIAPESVTAGKLGKEAITAANVSGALYAQLIKNVSYVNSASVTNVEPNKTATAECPAGKQAVGGGVRLEGELANVATTGSYPYAVGALRPGWTAIAHETGGAGTNYGDWSIVAYAVCAEL